MVGTYLGLIVCSGVPYIVSGMDDTCLNIKLLTRSFGIVQSLSHRHEI